MDGRPVFQWVIKAHGNDLNTLDDSGFTELRDEGELTIADSKFRGALLDLGLLSQNDSYYRSHELCRSMPQIPS